MTVLSKLFIKSGSNQLLLHPETEATQVSINDANGNASTVATEIVALRTQISELLGSADAMVFKGIVSGTSPNILPASGYGAGWTYKVTVAGTYAGKDCEVGDILLAIKDYAESTASNDDWAVVQGNIDGAVTHKKGNDVSFAGGDVAVFDDTTGKVIRSSGYTIGKSVPSDALFTDTTYSNATTTTAGLMSTTDKAKLDGIASEANKYSHPEYTAATAGFYKVTVDGTGHVSAATAVVKSDITGLGIPGSDTTYSTASSSADGLMSKEDKSKLDNIDTQANKYTHPAVSDSVAAAAKSTLGLYNITVDATGHVASATAVAKTDITALGIPASDTTYDAATTTTAGLMSAADKAKLDGIATEANKYVHATYTAKTTSDVYKITVDSEGHVSAATAATLDDITTGTTNVPFTATLKTKLDGIDTQANKYTHPTSEASTAGETSFIKVSVDGTGHVIAKAAVAKSDITALGIPGSDTTYSDATSSASGLMSGTDKAKLDGISSGAEVNQNAFSKFTIGSTDLSAGAKTDTMTITAGTGISLTPASKGNAFTVAATQVFTCVVDDLQDVPDGLVDGGLIVLVPAES